MTIAGVSLALRVPAPPLELVGQAPTPVNAPEAARLGVRLISVKASPGVQLQAPARQKRWRENDAALRASWRERIATNPNQIVDMPAQLRADAAFMLELHREQMAHLSDFAYDAAVSKARANGEPPPTLVIAHAAPALLADRAFMLSAIDVSQLAMDAVAPSLRARDGFVVDAIRQRYLVATRLQPEDVDSVAKIRAIGDASPDVLAFAPIVTAIKQHPELYTGAVTQDFNVFADLDKETRRRLAPSLLESVPKIVLTGTRDLPLDDHLTNAVKKVAQEAVSTVRFSQIGDDPRLTGLVATLRPSAIEDMSAAQLAQLAPQGRPELAPLIARALALHLPLLKTRVKTPEIMERVIRSRELNQPDGRPLAVVLAATADWNKAFNDDGVPFVDLLRSYRVMYYEVSNRSEALEALRQATAEQQASVLMISGHGEPNAVWFGDYVPGRGSHPGALSLSDRDELARAGLAARIAKGAQIVLDSCSTGHGGATGNNVANMLGELAPWASVDAPLDPSSVWNIELSADGLLNGVAFVRSGYYHRAAGTTVTPLARRP